MFGYAGNDASYPTSVSLIAGSDPPVAANFQTGYEGTLDRTASLQNRGSLSPLVSLQPPFTTQTLSTFASAAGPHGVVFNDTALAVDPVAGQSWLMLVWTSGHTAIQVFAGWGDQTNAWVQVGGNVAYTTSGTTITVDSGGTIYIGGVGGVSSTQADIASCPPGGSFSTLALTGLTTPTDLQLATIGTAVFWGIGSSTGGSAKVSGTGGGGFSGLTASNWIVRSNGSMVLFVPAVAQATPTIYKATGTATYTSAAIGLATTDIPQDLTWSAAWSLWFLVVKTVAGATTVWSSPDGAAWTLVKTLSVLPKPLVGLTAIGPHLIGTLDAPSFGNISRVVTSSDGGLTWAACPTGVPTNSATGPIINRPVAGPAQVFFGQTVGRGSAGSPNMRFSAIAGRGDVALT
jgi:hypothetical protein